MEWLLILMVMVRIGLAIPMYLVLREGRFKAAFTLFGVGVVTILSNVVLARYFAINFDFGPVDGLATGVFYLSVMLGLLAKEHYPRKLLIAVVAISVIAFAGIWLPTGDFIQMISRAILLFTSIIAMMVAVWIIAIETYDWLGIVIIGIITIFLIYLGFAWDLIINNIQGA